MKKISPTIHTSTFHLATLTFDLPYIHSNHYWPATDPITVMSYVYQIILQDSQKEKIAAITDWGSIFAQISAQIWLSP